MTPGKLHNGYDRDEDSLSDTGEATYRECLHCKAWKGDLKTTRQNKLHLQENSMRIDLEANQDPSGIYFKMRLREPRSSKRIS